MSANGQPRAERRYFDLNADLGEGYGRWSFDTDVELLAIISSANVACGFHAGDPSVIRQTLSLAAANDVAVGAHVAYPDFQGFGRRTMEIPHDELRDIVLYQLAALDGLARVEGVRVSYVKPHGALYNRIAVDDEQAAAVIEAIATYDPTMLVLGLPGARSLAHAHARGLSTRREAFADRAYLKDGNLAPRAMAGAVLSDPATIAQRAVRMIVDGRVDTIDGTTIEVDANCLCVHGDTPAAVEIAGQTRRALENAGPEACSSLLPRDNETQGSNPL